MIMKHVILLLLLSYSLLFAQKSYREEEIRSKIKSLNKITAGNYQPTPNQLQYDVKYYGININITPATRYINGVVTIISIAGGTISVLELDLSRELVIDSVLCGNNKTTYTFTNNLLKVNLDRQYLKNDEIRVSVVYHGNPGSSGFGSFGSNEINGKRHIWTLSEPFGARDWWPCKDHPYDKADSADINITVPKELVVASNGSLRNVIETGDKKTYYWHEGYPISTYLISVTAYPYYTFSNYYRYSTTDSMEIQYYTFLDKFNPRYEQFSNVPNMIKIFSDLFGQYPFMKEKYGHAEFPWGGGMEHQTCTSLGSFGEMLIVHELAHQWWGDMITCRDFHNIWLNEGFATYSEALYAEKAYGKKRYTDEMNGSKFFGSGKIYVDDLSNISRIFSGDLTYNKASWILHMLRHVVSDSTFFKLIKEYYQSVHKFDAINTEEFQKVCEKVYQKDLGWFFKQWIYEEYYPKYQYYYQTSKAGSRTNIVLNISQKQTNYIFKMPIDVNITTSLGDTTLVVFDSLKSQSFNLTVNGDITKLALDKDEWILRTVDQIASSVQNEIIPENYILFQNYPNPFNPGTEISFYLPREENISLKVYDILGRELTTLFEGKMEQGNHKIDFNSNRIPGGVTSGLYFYKLTTQSFSGIKKMMLLK